MYLTGGLVGFAQIMEDALTRLTAYAIACGLLSAGRRLALDEVRIYSWPQAWSDCSCGFGGLAGQAMTMAQTTVFVCDLTGAAVVYHDGRYAYLIKKPTYQFWQALSRHNLPGQAAFLRCPQDWDAEGSK